MSEFFVKLVIANIHRAYQNNNTATSQSYFLEILVTVAIEKIREHIVKEGELESKRKINQQAQQSASISEVKIEGEDKMATLKKEMEDIDHELLTINREIYAAVKMIGDLVYNELVSVKIAQDIVREITARDKNIGQRRRRHH